MFFKESILDFHFSFLSIFTITFFEWNFNSFNLKHVNQFLAIWQFIYHFILFLLIWNWFSFSRNPFIFLFLQIFLFFNQIKKQIYLVTSLFEQDQLYVNSFSFNHFDILEYWILSLSELNLIFYKIIQDYKKQFIGVNMIYFPFWEIN
jgi:hypothetical protein